MYYLLEDNSVITDEDITKNDWFIRDGAIFVEEYVVAKHELCTFKISSIKKQSKNIYDLIEAGDFVLFDELNGAIVTDVMIRKSDGYLMIELNHYESCYDIMSLSITAIYKPQKEQKRFICVWEAKDYD